jgi:tetratricopeptide (TPR) repeat protein
LVGIFGAVGFYFSKLYDKKSTRHAAVAIGVIILALFAVRTMVRNTEWKNEDVLWVATVKSSPTSPNAHNNMGDVYSRHGRHDLAAQEFARAIELKQDYGDAYHNLGNALQNQGKLTEAKEWYNKTLEINPNIWQTYAQLASIAAEEQDYIKAEEYLKKSQSLSPNNPDILINLAVLYYLKDDREQARSYLQQGLMLSPNHPKGQQLLKDLQE